MQPTLPYRVPSGKSEARVGRLTGCRVEARSNCHGSCRGTEKAGVLARPRERTLDQPDRAAAPLGTPVAHAAHRKGRSKRHARITKKKKGKRSRRPAEATRSRSVARAAGDWGHLARQKERGRGMGTAVGWFPSEGWDIRARNDRQPTALLARAVNARISGDGARHRRVDRLELAPKIPRPPERGPRGLQCRVEIVLPKTARKHQQGIEKRNHRPRSLLRPRARGRGSHSLGATAPAIRGIPGGGGPASPRGPPKPPGGE